MCVVVSHAVMRLTTFVPVLLLVFACMLFPILGSCSHREALQKSSRRSNGAPWGGCGDVVARIREEEVADSVGTPEKSLKKAISSYKNLSQLMLKY
jgi:hypothetical protein